MNLGFSKGTVYSVLLEKIETTLIKKYINYKNATGYPNFQQKPIYSAS